MTYRVPVMICSKVTNIPIKVIEKGDSIIDISKIMLLINISAYAAALKK